MAGVSRRVRRGYSAQFVVKKPSDARINPLHLTVSRCSAELLKKEADDDTFVCALRIGRSEKSPSPSAGQSPSKSKEDFLDLPDSPVPVQATSSFWSAEDIAVCVWASDDCDDVLLSPDDGEVEMTLFCSSEFLTHYNLKECIEVFIRPLQVYPISKAVFTVSDPDAYEWLQREKFSTGLLQTICEHDILVVQNDSLLSPYPDIFLQDKNFHRSWFFRIKAIACAPFLLGLMSSNTEIIICFEEETQRLPSDHGHLTSSSLDKYVSGTLYVSDFCRSLSVDSGDGIFSKDSSQSPVDAMTFNVCVIQQERNWRVVLSNADNVDLNTIIGIPRKLMLQYGLFDGSLLKISLVVWNTSDNSSPDIVALASKGASGGSVELGKEKFVRVKSLSKQLSNTSNVFVSSILLFNMQSGPPINMAPVIMAQKSTFTEEETGVPGAQQTSSQSRSLATSILQASEVHVAIVNSPSYSPKCSYTEALRKHFSTARILSVGDIFAVRSSDDPEFWQDAKSDTGHRRPVMFFKVTYMAPRQPDLYPYYVHVSYTRMSERGSTHSHVPLGADKYLSPHKATYGQGVTCAGLDHLVSRLERLVLPHIRFNPDGEHMLELQPSILLTGSEGVGKTTLVETVARRLYLQVQQVNCHDLCGDSAGSVEARLKNTFLAAAVYSPCILLLKNIEVIGKEKDGTTEDPRVISSFHRNITELTSQQKSYPVVVIATTHSPHSLSDDMHQCFLHELHMEAPTEQERGEILQGLLESENVSADVSVGHIAQRTAGFVLGDLIVLMQRAKREAYSKTLSLCDGEGQGMSVEDEEDAALAGVVLEQTDFDQALDVMQSAHSDAIGAPQIPNVRWEDVGGLVSVKEDILDTIQLPLQHPELLAAGLRRSGVLLYGPPGTGKTLLAKAVATECSLNFLSVKGPELINMYVGQSEANVREVFRRARSASPCVIFFDELDSLAPNRGRSGDSGGVMDRVVSQLLAELDGLHKSYDVFIIGATNRPDLLDPALLRPGRFDKLLYLGVASDRRAQLNILNALTRKFQLSPGLDLGQVVEKCPLNMTGADFYALCADAMLNAVRSKIALLEAGQDVDQTSVAVGHEDFSHALLSLVPSVSVAELDRYKDIHSKLVSA
ncbi:peroxisomal ATPase PEX6-like [Babylonia areolata]|uniref:peroxisomal ATPase PEX6-like n=1 Tax=Babylonia areolata TaxID=304850 RepID=UPI003FD4D0F0